MVAKITPSQKMRGILYYNENKVTEGEARLILASGFAGNAEQLSREQKMNRFSHLLRLKPNVKTNAIHITLNFHSREKLEDGKLQQITLDYMERIGFGDQPFLAYRHLDAAHTHVHIVTTNITAEGKRIDLHNIGLEKSEPARKAIELEFNLVKAEGREAGPYPKIKKIDAQKISYGRLPTKRAISNVLTAVNRDYKFSSLAEYNAVLQCFGVLAIRGEEHTEMFRKKGLIYSVINNKGEQIGVPIKASAFAIRPTLRNLEARFVKLSKDKGPYREDLKRRIDHMFARPELLTKSGFVKAAEKQGITVRFRENAQGLIFGITYVDHQNKCVFNGSDLGKAYSAKEITRQFSNRNSLVGRTSVQKSFGAEKVSAKDFSSQPTKSTLEILLQPVQQETIGMPKRKKKKKKQQQLSI